ncbi:glycosyltransferase family 9 protein [Flammeovirgaceae bacterium SG7u.111]|nr:glycosyltransferase family 9 protein [Flammeovirgaceae bacterium SG7u.132]WPO33555.1 glycosyltransferase family 9 protein [Flammeovirgaceae bacterium SG7u.111]
MQKTYNKILIAQTAFIGDVILATGLIESLTKAYPNAQVDFLLRKGNEGLFQGHPKLHKVLVWNKKEGKTKNLIKLIGNIRQEKYDLFINLQRFASSGILTVLSGAKETRGFSKNPLSAFFSKNFEHNIAPDATNPPHEAERNHSLITDLKGVKPANLRLYPTPPDFDKVKNLTQSPYICVAPASVWHTKQLPAEKWASMIDALPFEGNIYLLGAPGDIATCEKVKELSHKENIKILAGQFSLLQSAALMKNSVANFVNDSAPMHISSSVDAPTCAVFCSTIPGFGFGPLSSKRALVEIEEKLDCRPCGLHGKSSCPKGHFNCAMNLQNEQFVAAFESLIS